MANNRISRYIGAIALGTVLVAVPGCTDTWDDHYNTNESAAGTTKTLWDVINDKENHPEFSRFADIVQHAKYFKDNTHAVNTYSYADILKGGQVNTVWIPDNDALTEQEYQKWMQMLGESRADGSSMDAYNVQQQFIGNHIALWRHNISGPGIDTVKMINGKNLEFNKTALRFEGIPLKEGKSGETYNIPTANGVLHVITGVAPFRYNFYEYLKFREPQTEFGKYVVGKDTTYFSASASIEGLPDENGNPTYVDSVYHTTNRLFLSTHYLPDDGADKWLMREQGFGAQINNEDSMFVVVMPSDAAWNAAYTKLLESHTYAPKYLDKNKGNMNSTVYLDVPDTLQDMSIKMDLISPLVFNINKQPKVGGEMWTLKKFQDLKGEGAEYLLNTFGDTLRAIGDWKPSDLFLGQPTEMSNGIAYEVDTWNFPSEYFTPDVEVEIQDAGVFYNKDGTTNRYKVGGASMRYSFSNEAFRDITDKYGRVSNNNFYHLAPTGPTAGPKVEIKLEGNSPNAYVPRAQVMSGKYDIQLVVVPKWYINIADMSRIDDMFYKQRIDTIVYTYDGEPDTMIVKTPTGEIDEHVIDSLASINKYKINATMYCVTKENGKETDGKDKPQKLTPSKSLTYDGLKVDTLTLAEDFEFPYSYKNMRYAYPTLYIEGAAGRNDPKDGYVFDLVIDKIILKRKN